MHSVRRNCVELLSDAAALQGSRHQFNMDDQRITRINELLESISYYWSIYEIGASRDLAELHDQIYDLQLDLQATVSVLPILQQETQTQDGVAPEQFAAGPSCVIPSLSGKIDCFENQIPRVQHLMQTLSKPITPEQLNEVLPILKSIPPLIDDFLRKRHAMVNQLQQQRDQPGNSRYLGYRLNNQDHEQYEHLIRCPQTPEQENQILQLLKSNPFLLNSIIIQRENYDLYLSWLADLDLDNGSSPAVAKQLKPQGAEDFVLRPKCIQHTVHDRQCNSANYRLESCQKINRLAGHVKNCKKGKNGNCSACKRLRFFYGHHASLCQVQDNKCPVPFCFYIKQKLKELPQYQQLIHRLLLRFEALEEIVQCRGHFC